MLGLSFLVACGNSSDMSKTEEVTVNESVKDEKTKEESLEEIEEPTPEPTAEPTPEPTPEIETVYKLSKSTKYDSEGNMQSQTTYEYDEKGQRVKSETTGNYTEVCIYDNEYDENGKIIKSTSRNEVGAGGFKTYEYDDADNLIMVTLYDADGMAFSAEKYDEAGNMTQNILYDSDGNIDFQLDFVYDAEGKKVSSESVLFIDGTPSSNTFEYKYENFENTIREISYWEEDSVFEVNEYEYDEQGNKTKCTCYDGNNNVCYIEEYEYIALEITK